MAEQFNIDFHCPHLPVPQRDFGNILINKLEIEPVLRIELIEEIRHRSKLIVCVLAKLLIIQIIPARGKQQQTDPAK